MVKMNYIFLVSLIFIICGASENTDISETTETCRGDWCLSKNFDEAEKNSSYETLNSHSEYFNSSDTNKDISEKEKHYLKKSEEFSKSTDSYAEKFQTETSTNNNLPQHLREINSTHTTEELSNATDVTEISGINISSTTQSSVTKSVSISTTKPSLPRPEVNQFLIESSKKNKKICFCDIEVNQCDINCCCDEDCSSSHFKVFTQCNDNNIMYDSKYCYNTNFIFGNNTSHEVIQNNKGLFCIVRENLKVEENYKSKAVITTLDAFNKSLQNKLFSFAHKSIQKSEFDSKTYLAGSHVWAFENGELKPFRISYSSFGFLCNSDAGIKYLVDEIKSCFYKDLKKAECGNSKIRAVLHYLKGAKIVSNPVALNMSELQNSSKVCKGCQENICISINSYVCQSINNTPDCLKISENSKDLTEVSCWSTLSHIQYQIWHNGSEGITKMNAYLWVQKTSQISNEFLSQLITEVKYNWVSSPKRTFTRSGNPGYLTGKPIIAGKKIQNVANGTADEKEAIQLSLDPKDWLTVLGSVKGICSSEDRIPIRFRENSQYMCSLKLSKENFSKEKCVELQNTIFKLLVGNDVVNELKENYFNKFVATFGNSRVEETGDWVQVLVDAFPIISSQAYFKSNRYFVSCKNIITDLFIDVVYSNTGSFLAPQAKILGVSFQFGKHRDLTYYCDTPGCENMTVQYFKLISSVHFVDVTKPAIDAFAEPLSLEVKLPHDFFYPFFSAASWSHSLSNWVLIVLFFIVSIVCSQILLQL